MLRVEWVDSVQCYRAQYGNVSAYKQDPIGAAHSALETCASVAAFRGLGRAFQTVSKAVEELGVLVKEIVEDA